MSTTAADVLVERLIDWGVDTIFGLPGDGINGVMESLRTHQDQIRFVHVRHEEAAAFMACGYAKFTGQLGVCLATSGPGGIHLLNGLYDAKLDRQPVLAITGMAFSRPDPHLHPAGCRAGQTVHGCRCLQPAHHGESARRKQRRPGGAGGAGLSGCGPLTIPADIQELDSGERSKRNRPHHTSDTPARSALVPDQAGLRQAAEILNAAKKPVILAGQGALDATDQLEQTAELLGAPIVKPLLGKGCVPDDSPYTTGGIGLLGTAPSQDALEECDAVLMVGTSFPYIEFMPKPGQARGIQIDIDPLRIGLRYPVEVGLVGDSRATLEALVPLLQRHRIARSSKRRRSACATGES